MIIRAFRLDRSLLNRGRIIIIQRVRFQDKV
ncbi:unknown [Clostridium sp. CAG:299]|nr:unknown [Clostridium sp. CAG:299]